MQLLGFQGLLLAKPNNGPIKRKPVPSSSILMLHTVASSSLHSPALKVSTEHQPATDSRPTSLIGSAPPRPGIDLAVRKLPITLEDSSSHEVEEKSVLCRAKEYVQDIFRYVTSDVVLKLNIDTSSEAVLDNFRRRYRSAVGNGSCETKTTSSSSARDLLRSGFYCIIGGCMGCEDRASAVTSQTSEVSQVSTEPPRVNVSIPSSRLAIKLVNIPKSIVHTSTASLVSRPDSQQVNVSADAVAQLEWDFHTINCPFEIPVRTINPSSSPSPLTNALIQPLRPLSDIFDKLPDILFPQQRHQKFDAQTIPSSRSVSSRISGAPALSYLTILNTPPPDSNTPFTADVVPPWSRDISFMTRYVIICDDEYDYDYDYDAVTLAPSLEEALYEEGGEDKFVVLEEDSVARLAWVVN